MEATARISMLEEDLDLVHRHRCGDADAFDEIFHRHSAMLFNLALRLSGDVDQASDLTQEIFLRVYRHLHRFRGGSSLKTWLYRVGLNHCRSRLRRRPAVFLPLAEEADDGAGRPLVAPGRNPEQRVLDADRSHRLAGALRKLPLVFREAVTLCDVQGLEYQEIAEILGVRIGTVRSRIARGRERLRLLLEEAP
jgi:RNA polymerase sigma-70 factor (ECF subfamily)